MMTNHNSRVSVVIRTLAGRFDYLERALFSLYCNDHPDIEAVIVFQGTDSEYLARLETLKTLYPEILIQILQNPSTEDQRALNLNLGMDYATGRYLAFLDDDDYVYPDHYSSLITLIQESGKEWAYADVSVDIESDGYIVRRELRYQKPGFSFVSFWDNNFIPIHTFLIDTDKIEDKHIYRTHPEITRMEDYYILINLAFRYEPAYFEKITSSYVMRTDGSNANMGILTENEVHEEKMLQEQAQWVRSLRLIKELEASLVADHYWLGELFKSAVSSQNKIIYLEGQAALQEEKFNYLNKKMMKVEKILDKNMRSFQTIRWFTGVFNALKIVPFFRAVEQKIRYSIRKRAKNS